MQFETLEARNHFSVAVALSASGFMTVQGDSGNNDIRVSTADNGANIVVKSTVLATTTTVFKIAASKVEYIDLRGNNGNDTLRVDSNVQANGRIAGGHGTDYIVTGGLQCVAYGNDATDKGLSDDNASDTLINNSRDLCTLYGQGGDDSLSDGGMTVARNGQSYEFWFGGSGNDRFTTVEAGNSPQFAAHIFGGDGNDQLVAGRHRTAEFHGENGVDSAYFGYWNVPVQINLQGLPVSGARYDANDQTYTIYKDVENADGGSGNDFITGNSSVNTLRGGFGNDVITGLAGNDYIYGGYGNDQLYGDDGNDHLYGEAGDDHLNGDSGSDFLQGDTGYDSFGDNHDGYIDTLLGDGSYEDYLDHDAFDIIVGIKT